MAKILSALWRQYNWALIPVVVFTAAQINAHLYFDVFEGYDMPQHFYNVHDLMQTGQMPAPPITANTYEAHQAPLFYILSAWITLLGDQFGRDSFVRVIPWVLFIVAMVWMLLLIALVQQGLRRAPRILRALTVSTILLIPNNVKIATMFGNDLPLLLFGTWGMLTLWFMLRANRLHEPTLWLRAAAICSLGIAFKNNGIILLGVYGLLVAFLVLRYHVALRLARVAALGLPLMLVPWLLNAYHATRYAPNVMGLIEAGDNYPDLKPEFFLTLNTAIFQYPFGFGPAESSFWSLQYVTLHNDYYNHWTNHAFEAYLPAVLVAMRWRPIPIWRFNQAVLLQYVALPLTGIMLFGFFFALYQVMFRPRRALRMGSILVVLLMLVSQAAQALRIIELPNLYVAIVHARFLSFLYPVLLIAGVFYAWKLSKRSGARQEIVVTAILSACMLAYSVVAVIRMWLPPV